MSFVHLHVHTQYSIADATTRVDEMVERAAACGMPALAMTDHDNLHGAVHFHDACKAKGIKPIYGCSMAIAAMAMGEHVLRTYQINLLAENAQGYQNLLLLISKAWLLAPPGMPARISHDFLAEHAGGLIALTGNLGGEVPNALLRGQRREAERIVARYVEIFGPGNVFIEVQRAGLLEHDVLMPQLLQLGEATGVPCVATNDVHYLLPEQARAHEVLMCIGLGIKAREDPAWLPTTSLDLADPDEMRRRFEGHQALCDRTLEIAERCNVELDLGKNYLPQYAVPEGETIAGYFEKVSVAGLEGRFADFRRIGKEFDEAEYRDRLATEIKVIHTMDFPGYFLIVWDFIRWAREQRIPVGPGRGSGAGSLVAYSLRITDIDPLPYHLLFERFLNPERVSMPDFDIDFCVNRRSEVIDYVAAKYGADHVAQIATFGTLKAKGAIRDCGRVLDLELTQVNQVTKLVPDQAKDIKQALGMEPALRALRDEDSAIGALLETAAQLEGAVRQVGMHAAGVVISEQPLWHYVPIMRGAAEENVTMFAKEEVERAGLVKFDFLGLKNLTMIQFCVDLINAGRGPDEEVFDIALVPLNSPEAFDVMCRGETAGIFQMESSGFTAMIQQLQPSQFEDIIAAGALYRPGPLNMGMHTTYIARKHGREPVKVDHPLLEPILRETYGSVVYQEQVMQIARSLAGYSLGGADLLRRAMGKKKASVMDEQRIIFEQGAVAQGIDAKVAGAIFETMASFAEYGFNKSHAAAYGLISYHTAWLKAFYPTEFFAALLTADKGDTDKVVQYIQEARRAGQKVLPPDINLSELSFSVVDGAIRFGLGAIKNVGSGAIEALLDARKDGPFDTLFDLCKRVDMRRVNRRVIESLAKCGALDSFGQAREVIWTNIDKAIERAQEEQRERATGQTSLFGDLLGGGMLQVDDAYAAARETWTVRQTLEFEKECLGFYVSGHPLDRYRHKLYRLSCRALAMAKDLTILRKSERGRVKLKVAVVVVNYRTRITQRGTRMAFAVLEDLSGQAEVMCFAKTVDAYGELLASEEPLLIGLTAEHDRADETKVRLSVDTVESLEDVVRGLTDHLRVTLTAEQCQPKLLDRLVATLREHPGKAPVVLHVRIAGKGVAQVTAAADIQVDPGEALIGALERVVGRGAISLG